MNTPEYSLDQIKYKYSKAARKWQFVLNNFTYLVPCHGAEKAHRVARQVAGAVKRCGGMDNSARGQISRILSN